MCGIVGKISLGEQKISVSSIAEMNKAVEHRGPDATDTYLSPDERVGLGHQRLAIIDLSPLGKQPMRYLDRYEIVFNGEIYNFQEKRAELEKKGYSFLSQSDTEVILALYAEYGKDCVQHLRGMFAFALYDEQEGTLFCARDRVGKKPFKYYSDDAVFLFASELKAILTQSEYTPEPDYEAIHHYLSLQYVPAPLTGFLGIKKLKPAHTLHINTKTKEITEECYWKLDYSSEANYTEKEWQEKIIDKLDESVRLRMIADVPLGAFLSGGVDSSAIVALMSRHSKTPVKTFSIGFREEQYNELPFARLVAEKFHTDHTEFVVDAKQALDTLPLLVRQYEEPFADSSALPTYLVSKLTRQHVTVALNGDGGDENFLGYNSYQLYAWSLWYSKLIPPALHRALLHPLIALFSRVFTKFDFSYRIQKMSAVLSQPKEKRFLWIMSQMTEEEKDAWYTKAFTEKMADLKTSTLFENLYQSNAAHSKDSLDTINAVDIQTYLPGALMPKVDIATMAVSLEGRSPFLDHEFLELAATIPATLKLKSLTHKKYILKEALRGIVPDEVMFRPKMGFGIPLNSWFRKELQQKSEDVLLNPENHLSKIIQPKYLNHILHAHQSGQRNQGALIWNLLCLELWFQEFFPDKK